MNPPFYSTQTWILFRLYQSSSCFDSAVNPPLASTQPWILPSIRLSRESPPRFDSAVNPPLDSTQPWILPSFRLGSESYPTEENDAIPTFFGLAVNLQLALQQGILPGLSSQVNSSLELQYTGGIQPFTGSSVNSLQLEDSTESYSRRWFYRESTSNWVILDLGSAGNLHPDWPSCRPTTPTPSRTGSGPTSPRIRRPQSRWDILA